MTCPSCKLENPPSASVCDCGYQFQSATGHVMATQETSPYLASIDRSLKTIKNLMVLWLLLSIAGFFVGMEFRGTIELSKPAPSTTR